MKTRKLLALVLAIAMIATVFVVPSAAVAPGAACEILGLLEGDGEGVTAEYLAKGTMRVQGLLITLRARGLEGEALAFTGTDTFSDAGDVAEFWAPILAYAYANPDLGWIGDGDGTFRPADIMTGAELAKVMLALLGYVQGEDFEWDDIATFAESKGVTVPEGEATNDDLAGSLVEALALETKEGGTLVDAMIADGVVTEEQALEAEVKETEPVVTTAFAVEVTGAKKVKAVFAEAQDTDTAIVSLKKGAVGQAITVEWDTSKKVATIKKAVALGKGDYTLTINGEAVDFTIEADETATELVVGATTVFAKGAAQDIKLHLLNQYGEKMQFGVGNLVGGASMGVFDIKADTAELTVAAGDKGKTVTVFAYYSPKNFTVNATITVVEDQILSSIVITGPVALGDESKKTFGRLTEGTDGNSLAFKALDQYGNTLKIADYVENTDYSFVVANAKVTVGDGKLNLTPAADLKAGTLTVRAVALKAGNISEMYTETVYKKPALASFDVVVPESLYADEVAEFKIEGVDQYGKAFKVKAADFATWNVNAFSTAGIAVAINAVADNTIKLKFNAKNGAADLYFNNGAALQVIKPVSVQAKKVVASIVSVPISTQALLKTKKLTVDMTKVAFNDQYGNTIKADALIGAGWKWELRRLTETNPYGVATTTDKATIFVINPGYEIEAQKPGTETLRIALYDGATYDEAPENKRFDYDFNLSVVKPADVVAYELKMADFMYANNPASEPHQIKVELIGQTANGTTVTLKDSGADAMPDIITLYTVSNNKVQLDETDSKLKTVTAIGDNDSSVVVRAWNAAGETVAEKTVVLKAAAPAVTTITLKHDKDNDKVELTAKDQYGIAIMPIDGNFYSSTGDVTLANKDVDNVNKKITMEVTIAAGKSGTVRFVSNAGTWTAAVDVK